MDDSSSSICRKRAIEELTHGCKVANKLQKLLPSCHGNEEWEVAEDLVHEVLNSFTNTLSVLNPNLAYYDDEVSHIQGPSCPSSPDNAPKSESSEEIISKSSRRKDRRGHHKRSRCLDSSSLVEDGHAWRKYGQKNIQDNKYPRSYYRCAHKFEQDCYATKQVQRIRENPPLFRTKYFGCHTCKNLQHLPQYFLDSSDEYDNSKLLSFGSSNASEQANQTHIFSSFSSEKKEKIEEVPSESSQNQSSSSNYLFLPELPQFDHGDEDLWNELFSN